MFTSNKLVIDIGSRHIKILYGTDKKIKKFGLLETPADCIEDNKILKVEPLADVIEDFFAKEDIDPKRVSYVIHGQDLIVRILDIPAMDEKNIEESVRWEINRNLPENGKNYYLDYQIISSEGTKAKKILKVLAAAVPIEKIERYMELTQKLDMQVDAIDISGNSMARVLGQIDKTGKHDNGIGVIFIGSKTTRISIIEKGGLMVEREVPFGTENLVKEIIKRKTMSQEEALRYIEREFTFVGSEDEDEINLRLTSLLDNVFTSFQKVVQFYATGRTQKTLDAVFVAGGGASIRGLANYLITVFSCEATMIDGPSVIGKKVESPKGFEFKYYLSAYGMLLRRDN